MNPADYASRGLTRSSNEQVHVWFNGAELLWKSEFQWSKQTSKQEIQDDDPEVGAEVKVHVAALHEGIIERLESFFSDWTRIKRVVTWILNYKKSLILNRRHQPSDCTPKALSPTDLDVSLLEYAQERVIRLHQQQVFGKEINHLRDGNKDDKKLLSRRSDIYNLDSYIDEKGLLRVGGRLKKSNLHVNGVHPVLLGNDGNIPRLIVGWCRKKIAHGGRGLTINEIRSNGFCVVWCNIIVRNLIGKCVKCQWLR